MNLSVWPAFQIHDRWFFWCDDDWNCKMDRQRLIVDAPDRDDHRGILYFASRGNP